MSSDLDIDLQALGVVMPESTRDKVLGVKIAGKDERAELAAISIDNKEEIQNRAAEARSGAPGIAWDEIKRDLLDDSAPTGAACRIRR